MTHKGIVWEEVLHLGWTHIREVSALLVGEGAEPKKQGKVRFTVLLIILL